MTDQIENKESTTDAAALAGGAVAVTASLFVSPGPFSVLNLAIGLTLSCIIVGYTWKHTRWWLQTLAVSASLGLASIPASGFALEMSKSRRPIQFLQSGQWKCFEGPCNEKNEPESQVTPFDLFSAWLIVTASFAIIDSGVQRSRRAAEATPQS